MPPSIPNIAAPSPAAIGAPQTAPNLGALYNAEKPNPLLQLLQAAGNFPQQQQQDQLAKLQIQQGKQAVKQGDFQLEQAQRQNLDQQWDRLGAMIKARPQYASDDTMKQQVTDLAQQRGVPVPLDDQGNIDVSVWQQQWDAIEPAQQQKLRDDALERPAGPARDALFAGIAGVPAELRTAPVSYDAKDQAALERAKAAGLKVDNEAAWNTQRAAYMKAKAHQIDFTLTADDQRILAQAGLYRAEAQAAITRSQADMIKAQAAVTRASRALASGGRGGAAGAAAIRSSVAETLSQMGQVDNRIDSLNENIQRLSATSDDPSNDPNIQALQAQVQREQQIKAALQPVYDAANQYNANNLGQGYVLQQQSGKRTTVKDAGPRPTGSIHGKNSAGVPGWQYPDGTFHPDNG